jgi:hypothetical protein
MKSILFAIAAYFFGVAAAAHPSGDASVLDHNIVAIEIKVPVNIPPKATSAKVVGNRFSACWMMPRQAESYDQSFSLKTDGGKVVSVILPLLEKPKLLHGTYQDLESAHITENEFVEFELASERDPRKPNPNIKSIRCGYSAKGSVVTEDLDVSKNFVEPSMNQLAEFTEGALRFIPGDTVEISGQ